MHGFGLRYFASRVMSELLKDLRSSFWFVPALLVVAAMRESIDLGQYIPADRRKLTEAADRAMRALSGAPG